MKKLFGLILFVTLLASAFPLHAQTFDAYELGGGTYLQTPSAVMGHLSVVKDISANVFSYTTIDFSQIQTGQPITSVRTGLGTFVDAVGPVEVFALADGGGIVNSTPDGTASTGAFAGGVLAGIPIRSNIALVFAAQALSSGAQGWNPLFEAGIVFKPNSPVQATASRLGGKLKHIF
jgi:hypothetical protein